MPIDIESPSREFHLKRNSNNFSVFSMVSVAPSATRRSGTAGLPATASAKWQMGDPRYISDSKWGRFRDKCGAFVNNKWVQYAMTFLIIVNAALMGTMTFDFVRNDPDLTSKLEYFDLSILCVFTVEFILQLVYLGKETRKNSWLVFDGTIAFFSWAFMGSSVKILRSFRIFRIFALVARLGSLRTLFMAVAQSVPKMASIWMILSMFFYVFAVLYTNLYSDLYDEGFLDWDYFGRLDRTLITLFQFMTLDSWTGVVRQVMDSDPYAFITFFIFVMTTSFVVLNLMIAVVCESLLNLKPETEEEDGTVAQDAQSPLVSTEFMAQQEELVDSQKELTNSHKEMHEMVVAVKQELKQTQIEMQKSLDEVKNELIRSQEEMQKTLKAILKNIS